jgi:ABC-type lipoprotein export system ATPase subunit
MVPYLSAIDNVKLIMQLSGKVDNSRAEMLIDAVGLSHRKNSKMFELSGGEQQRVAIAIALANDPPILLADEPTGAVDTKTTAQIMELFSKLNREMGVTVIIVTHDRQLSHMVPSVVTISDGRIGTEFIRHREMDLSNAEELLDATAGHDSGTNTEYAFVDGRRRIFIPENYLDAAGIKVKSKVAITMDGNKIVLEKAENN